jgi:exopolyphosphatase / guanosine-5'-triphosphate,3'-diphosphate pyrophosphatase
MRIAAIDIGTNSVHMIVVRIRPDLSFEVIDREKEMVRLGAGGLDGRALTEQGMTAALQALSKFRRLAESHQVDEILAAATSATREASNGREFLAAVERQTGIIARVISGTEEARLIHLAAAYGVHVTGSAVTIDVGGGSVEITLGPATGARFARSFKIGVIRLTERFVQSDPLSGRDERKLVKHIHSEVDAYLADIAAAGFDCAIGTSGTMLSLGAVAVAEDRGRAPEELRNLRVSARRLHRLRKQVVGLDIAQRLKLPGLDPRRVDLIVAGAVLADTLIQRLGASDLTLCDLALREGLILDYIRRNRRHIAHADRYPDVRRRSAIELAERCGYWPEHAHHVARLALSIFDQTRSLHALADREREWLEYGALLHDIGLHISYPRHHKHSYYLIKNGDLRGFDPDETEVIGLLARYHRNSTPKKSHKEFGALRPRLRRVVRTLSAILRLAEGLDRSHAQSVSGIEIRARGRELLVNLRIAGDAELELWAARRQVEPLQAVLGKTIRLGAGGTSYVEQPQQTARVSGQAVRGRRHRRLGQDDAARAAGQVADRGRSERARHGMELVGARQGRHQDGQEEERPDADDVQPAARH